MKQRTEPNIRVSGDEQPPPQPSYALEQYIGSEDGVVDRLLKGEKGTQARGRWEELSGELEKLSEKITGS